MSELSAENAVELIKDESCLKLLRNVWEEVFLKVPSSLGFRAVADGEDVAMLRRRASAGVDPQRSRTSPHLHNVLLPQPMHVEAVARGVKDVAESILRKASARSRREAEGATHLLRQNEH